MKDPLLSKTPPHNLDTEESLLASLFIDNSGFEDIFIEPSDFYKSAHQKIFNAMLSLRNKKEPVDLVTVGHWLQDNNQLEEIGGGVFLMKIADTAPIALHIKKYGEDIKSLSVKRNIIITSSRILEKAMGNNNSCDELLSFAQKSILEIQNTNTADNLEPLKNNLYSHLDRIEKYQTTSEGKGFSFGLEFMDKTLRLIGSKLIIIAARPSVGKTGFALSAAKYIAEKHGIKTGFLSLEMDKEPLYDRLLSLDSDINHMKFYQEKALSSDDLGMLIGSVEALSTIPLYIDDSGCNIQDIQRKCRKMKKEGFGAIFIDQLSKISGDPTQSDYKTYTSHCNQIALLKKELKIPIFLLAQLNRKLDDTASKEPTLSTLKQTGALEEDSDIVLFIHRPWLYDKKEHPDQVKITCAKNRQGAVVFDEGRFFKANRGMFDLGNYKYGG